MKALLLFLLRLYVGLYMAYYSLPKIKRPSDFLKNIRLYEMVPENPPWLLNGMAVWIPWMELLAGLFLVLGIARRGAATLLTFLLVIFSAAILWRTLGIFQAQDIAFCDIAFDCGCGTGEVIICHKLPINFSLILAAAWIACSQDRSWSLTSKFSRRRNETE
ncbi:MAG: DoxX family membrane protein [Planctomycetota bacterium]|nr:MAG: DoxX family membrane protein [Planctomycetota bacterium]